MKTGWFRNNLVLSCAVAFALIPATSHAEDQSTQGGWDRQAAARYLDGREAEWQDWDRPHKDRATLCISCHTQATYGLARPVLHQVLNDETQTPAEKAFLASIQKRVSIWSQMQPFYSDIPSGAGKEVESV